MYHCIKSLPTLGVNQVCQCGRKRLRSGLVKYKFFFQIIFKLKEKILVNFSMASQND